jgi:hypothetical protein
MRVRRLAAMGVASGCLGGVAAPAPAAPPPRLGYVTTIRASWAIAVEDCPSCSQANRSSGTFRTAAGRAVVRRRGGAFAIALAGTRRVSRVRCAGPDLSADPLPPAQRALTLEATPRGTRALRFAWRLPACDPDVDQPVADAVVPAATFTRAYLRRGTTRLRLRGRRAFDVAPDADFPPPDLGPPPGHWTGTLTWSLTVELARCRAGLSHGRRVRRCAF